MGMERGAYRGPPLGVGANGSPVPSLMGASREAGWGASRQRGKVSVRPGTWRPAMAAMRRDHGEIVNLPPRDGMSRKCHGLEGRPGSTLCVLRQAQDEGR